LTKTVTMLSGLRSRQIRYIDPLTYPDWTACLAKA